MSRSKSPCRAALDAAWDEQALKGAEYGWTMMLGKLDDLVTTTP